jgi:ABC-type phosphate transport system substrate-binding protein
MYKYPIACSAALVAITSYVQAETLKLGGSTTFDYVIMQPYKQEIEKTSRVELVVAPSKSSGGILSLFEGRVDIAMLSAPLSAEMDLLRGRYLELPLRQLHHFPIARTRMAFAVNPETAVRSLSAHQMRRVLLGEIENWQELGGPNLPIRLVMVRDGGGVKVTVEHELLGGKPVSAKDPIYVQIGSQVVRIVRQLPGTMGLAQLKNLRKENLPEIVLTDQQIFQELSLVTLGEPTVAAKAVIDAARDVARKLLAEE